MIIFLLYTIVAVLANACMAKILHFSIQDGQWIDTLFKWQYRLRKWAEKGKWWVKPLGLCEMCFSHFIAVMGFIIYCLFVNISGINALHHWFLWFVTYCMYVGLTTNASLYLIVKAFNSETDH